MPTQRDAFVSRFVRMKEIPAGMIPSRVYSWLVDMNYVAFYQRTRPHDDGTCHYFACIPTEQLKAYAAERGL